MNIPLIINHHYCHVHDPRRVHDWITLDSIGFYPLKHKTKVWSGLNIGGLCWIASLPNKSGKNTGVGGWMRGWGA